LEFNIISVCFSIILFLLIIAGIIIAITCLIKFVTKRKETKSRIQKELDKSIINDL